MSQSESEETNYLCVPAEPLCSCESTLTCETWEVSIGALSAENVGGSNVSFRRERRLPLCPWLLIVLLTLDPEHSWLPFAGLCLAEVNLGLEPQQKKTEEDHVTITPALCLLQGGWPL